MFPCLPIINDQGYFNMPIEYSYDDEEKEILCLVSGTLTSGEIVEYFGKIISDKRIKDFYEIVNLSEVNDLVVRYSDLGKLRKQSKIWKGNGHKFTFFLTPTETSKGIVDLLTPVLRSADIFTYICSKEDELTNYLSKIKAKCI